MNYQEANRDLITSGSTIGADEVPSSGLLRSHEFVLPPPPEQPTLHDYIKVVRKRLPLILSIAAAFLGSAILYTSLTDSLYTASTLVEIRGYAPVLSNIQSETLFGNDTRKIEYQKTTVAKLNLAGLADQVLSRDDIYEALQRYWGTRQSYLDRIKSFFKSNNSEAGGESEADDRTNDDHFVHKPGVIQKYLSLVDITPIHETNLVRIEVTTTAPHLSQKIANAHATGFIDHLQRERQESIAVNLQLLQRQGHDLKERVTTAEQALATYAERNKLLTLPNEQGGNLNIHQIEGLAGMLADATGRRIKAETLLDEASGKGTQEGSVTDDEITRQLRVTLKQAEAEYATMGSRVTAAFPGMVELRAKIENLKRSVQDERKRTVRGLRSQFEAEKNAEEKLREQIEREKSTAHETSKRLIQYNVLSKEAASLRDLYQAVLKQVKEIEISAQSTSSNVFVSDFASLPTSPSAPKSDLIIVLFTVLGLGTGLVVSFVLESFDTTFKSTEEVQKGLDLPLLGAVPQFDEDALGSSARSGKLLDHSRGENEQESTARVVGFTTEASETASFLPQRIVAVSAPGDAVSEALRTIRAGILLSSADNPPRVVMISSAMKGEGKTTIVSNLAVTLAQASHRTLMIDADLRVSQLSEIFQPVEAPTRVGLTDLLTGQAQLNQVIHRTAVPCLDILPAGSRAPNPAELLGSHAMGHLIHDLQQRYDFVLMDSPPVLPVADGLMLSRLVDSVVLVVRSRATDRKVAQEARRRLLRVNARVLGVVLNDLNTKGDGYDMMMYGGYGA
jgi:capsular exopolysaccharide synthesis family protein